MNRGHVAGTGRAGALHRLPCARALLACVFLTAACFHARSATESWNPGGAGGGNGTWDTGVTPNWSSGFDWSNGNDAVFGGTGGTITVVNPSANSLTFSASGPYILQSGTLTLSGSDISVNSNTTIASPISFTSGLLETGTGTLTLTGSDNSSGNTVDVEFGTLAIQSSGTLSDSLGYIGNNAGSNGTVTVSGSGSAWINNSGMAVGNSGTGAMLITNGATVATDNPLADSSIGLNAGSSGTVTVSGSGSSWSSGTLEVGHSGTGTLLITGGGAVSDSLSYIGNDPGSNGMATVSGTGSKWTTTNGFLYVGNSGTASLLVTQGGYVSATVGEIGANSASSGTATVTGTGSALAINDGLFIGDGLGGPATGALLINNGGVVSASGATLGNRTGSTGMVTVTGSGSLWEMAGGLSVGNSGTGMLLITGGGAVSNGSGIAYIADGTGSSGTVTVSGSGSLWTNSSLVIGESGTGDLVITGGGSVVSSADSIGDGAGSNGTVTVSGSGSSLTENTMYVGNSGTGTLQINGGTVSTNFGYVGSNAGSDGSVTVSGSGATWSCGVLELGTSGTGTLAINGGGAVSSGIVAVGYEPGSHGTLTVSGTGSAFTVSTDLYIADGPTGPAAGTLLITNGGVVASPGYTVFGNSAGSNGSGTISGEGSTFTTPTLYVGTSGTGTLQISGSAAVLGQSAYLGQSNGSTGTVTVTGTGSSWSASDQLYVGNSGTGTLQISNGATVSTGTYGYVGTAAASSGMVTVSGAGSSWTGGLLSTFYIGQSGTGTLLINTGGAVSDAFGYIGANTGSAGTATVSGSNSSWTNSTSLEVGGSGSGTLSITGGATVSTNSVSGGSSIGTNAGTSGMVTVSGSGSEWTNSGYLDVGYAGTATLLITGGAIVSDGGGGGNIGYDGGSSGSVTVSGTGSEWNNANALYIGGNYGSPGGNGVLLVTAGGLVSAPQTTIWTTGTLAIGENVTINGPMAVNGGTVTLDDGQIQTVTLTSPVTIAAGSNLDFEVGNTSDQIALSGSGTLNVTGPATVNIYGLSGQVTSGTDVLISASTGNLALGDVYNSGNYTYAILTTSSTQDLVVSATTPLTTAYWKGSQDNLWSILVSGTATNWTTDQAGTNDPHLTPSATTNVIFSASGDINESNTVLGADMTVSSLTFTDTNAIVIAGTNPNSWLNPNTLTISGAAGISDLGAGPVTISANIALGANQSWTVNSANRLTVNGQVSGPFSLTTAGSGVLALSGDDTYTGATTVSNASLIVTGSLNRTASASVASGASLEVDGLLNAAAAVSGSLSGVGTVGAVTLSSGGVLAPGLQSGALATGTLTATGNVSLSGTSTFSIRLGINSGTDHDQLTIGNGGTISLNGANLQLTLGTGFKSATTGLDYVIISGGAAGTGTGGNVFAQGSGIISGRTQFEILYASDASGDGFGTGSDVVLKIAVIPEPATWTTMLAGLAMLAFVRRFSRGRRAPSRPAAG